MLTLIGKFWHYFIAWPLFGIVVGAIARFIMPGAQPMSWLMTMVLGIGGSIVGGSLAAFLSGGEAGAGGWIASVIGAFLILFLYPRIKASLNKTEG